MGEPFCIWQHCMEDEKKLLKWQLIVVLGGNIKAGTYFADHGADNNAKVKYGRRPLHFLCYDNPG